MIVYDGGARYEVDVLYGYSVVCNRGIKYSVASDGSVGLIDREINSTTCAITIQSQDLKQVREYFETQKSFKIILRAGEYIFGADKSHLISSGYENQINVNLLNYGKLIRKDLNLWTMTITLAQASYMYPNSNYTYSTPSFSELRVDRGYESGAEYPINRNELLNGSFDPSSKGLSTYRMKFTSELTNEEMAIWRKSLIEGDNRTKSTVISQLYPDYSDINFYIESFTETHIFHNRWQVEFNLILDKKAST